VDVAVIIGVFGLHQLGELDSRGTNGFCLSHGRYYSWLNKPAA
jgi:hypothetical protein